VNKSFCDRYWKQVWLRKGHKKKPLVTSFFELDVDKFMKKQRENIPSTFTCHGKDGKTLLSIYMTKEAITPKVEGYEPASLPIETVKCHFGGERYYIRCTCGKRYQKLYMCCGFLVCRKCLGAQYESQSTGSFLTFCKRQDKVDAVMKRKDPNWDGLGRPPYMHRSTYHKLMTAHFKAEEKYTQKIEGQFEGRGFYL